MNYETQDQKLDFLMKELLELKQRIDTRLEASEQKLDTFEQKFETQEQAFNALKQILLELEQKNNVRMAALEQWQKTANELLEVNNNILLRMELEHGEKLQALFESHFGQRDSIEELRPRVFKLEQIADTHTLEIAYLKTPN